MSKRILTPCFVRHIGLGLLCAVLLWIVPACFGSKTPERTYFSIDYALGEQPHYASPKHDASVVVRNFTTVNAYDRQEIIYRSNPYEFQYYWYRLWASKPRKMLREIVSKHLRYTNIFSDVTLSIEDKMPDYELDVDITAIEELDASNTEWYAHLAMRMTLTEFKHSGKGTVIWTDEIDVKNAVADNQPVYVVKAMSELLDRELARAFADMDKAIGRRAGSMPKNMPDTAYAEDAAKPSDRSQEAESSDGSQEAKPSDRSQEANTQADMPEASVSSDMPRATLKNKR